MRRARFGGLRFQKRVKLLPGVHLNLSLSGVGVSAGGRGFHVGMTARGQKYVSAGLPGTGLSVRQYTPAARIGAGTSSPRPAFSHGVWIAFIVLAVLLAIAGAVGK
jgi:Protein of unknown function (DUF4236)